MDALSSVQATLKNSAQYDGLAVGFANTCSALTSKSAILVFLADDADVPIQNKQKVEEMCRDANVPLIKVPGSKELGDWCGSATACSAVGVIDFGIHSEELSFLAELVGGFEMKVSH
jgi:ribosomal protein L7Ae-like RNA K-turn-binding protein